MKSPNPPVMALKRGLDIYEFITANASNQGVGLSDIAEFMDLKLTTVHNLVKTLEMCGFVCKEKAGCYSPGWKLKSLFRISRLDISPQGPAMKVLIQAEQKIGHDLVLTSLVGGKRIVLSRIMGSQLIRVDSKVADSNQKTIWQVVTGRVLAAYCEERELEKIVAENGMPNDSWQDIKTEQQLEKQLKKIKTVGYAENITALVASIALPVLLEDRSLAGALGVFLPKDQYTKTKKKQIIDAIKICCNELSKIGARSF